MMAGWIAAAAGKVQRGLVRGGTMIRARVRLGLAGVIVVTAILIGLTWLGTFAVTRTQQGLDQARVAASLASQAALFADQAEVDLLEIDQTLRVLAQAWAADSEHFQLLSWRDNLVLLNRISPDLFIADEHGTVRDGTVPESVGSDVGDQVYFRALAERIFDDGRMFVSPSTLGGQAREWHLDLARPLHHRDGSFAGTIVATLRIGAISNFYRLAHIGTHGAIAIVGLDDGRLRLGIGANPIDPGSNIADSDMFRAMKADPDGVWVGRTALDGVERVHGFHHVADRGLAVVVAMDRDEALQPTEQWTTIADRFAAGITLLLVLFAAMAGRAIRAAQRQEAAVGQERAFLASATTELEATKARADARTKELEATFAGTSDGVAVVDGNMRLVEWNARFADIAGVARAILHAGLPMEEILRAQAKAGLFGNVDVETEVTRQVAALRTGDFAAIVQRARRDGRIIELRRRQLPHGGLVLLCADVTARQVSMNTLSRADFVTEVAPAPRSVQPIRRRLPRTRLLLVEDVRAGQLFTAASLRREGHLVDVAGSGADAIAAVACQPYDLILIDVAVPDTSGLDAARQIRRLRGPASVVPIIALTAGVGSGDDAACAAAGMDGVLARPVAPGVLADAIAQHVWLRRADQIQGAQPDAPVAMATDAILSSARLDELRAMLPADTLANRAEECLFDLSERLALLREAVRGHSSEQVLVHANAMAGMAAEFGMTALEALLRRSMDAAARSPEAAGALTEVLQAELFRAAAALREALHIEMV